VSNDEPPRQNTQSSAEF